MLSIVAALVTSPLPFINLSTKGLVLQRVLQTVGAVSGERYECSSDLAQEPLIVDVKQADPAELRERLAWVMDAEWEKTSTGWRIARPENRKRQLLEDLRHRRAKSIAPVLDQEQKLLAGESNAYERARKAIEAFRKMSAGEKPTLTGGSVDLGTPADLLCRQLLVDIGADALAALPLHKPVIFSDKPNPMQRPLPRHASKAIKEFVDSQRWIASLGEIDWKASNSIQTDWWKTLISQASALCQHGKVLLLCIPGENNLFTVLFEFNDKGQLCASSSRNPNFPPTAENLKTSEPEKYIQLSQDSAEISRLMGNPKVVPSKKAWSLLSEPTVNDPVSFAPAEAVWAAREKGQMLIARLPDEAVRLAAQVTQKDQMNVTAFLQAVTEECHAEVTRSDKWYSLRPRNSLLWEDVRLSRTAAERFLNQVNRMGAADLRSTSKFWYEAGDRAPLSSLWGSHHQLLASMKIKGANFGLPISLYRFLGGLDDATWNRVLQGNAVNVGFLPQELKDLFMAWTNGGFGRLEEAGIGLIRRSQNAPTTVPDQWLIGAEAMTQGVQPGVLFEVQSQNSLAIQRIFEDGTSLEYSLNHLVGETANQVYSQEGSTVASVMTDRYIVGHQTQYLFRGLLRQEVEIRRTCGDISNFGTERVGLPYAQLSKDFRTTFEDLVAKAIRA